MRMLNRRPTIFQLTVSMATRMLENLLFFGLGFTAIALAGPYRVFAQNASAPKVPAVAEYGKLPLSFEANRGQADPRVWFTSRGDGYGLSLTDTEAVLSLGRKKAANLKTGAHPLSQKDTRSAQAQTETEAIRMQLVGASKGISARGQDQLPGSANYFLGNDPSKWHTDVPTYGKVRFKGVYDGVDLLYYGNQRQLEYDFVVAPHADPQQIRLHFEGARKLTLAANGDLQVAGRHGQIAFQKPVLYQQENDKRRNIHGHFTLLAKNTVGFSVGGYNHDHPLVIDPVLSYSTYLGGSGGDYGFGVAADSQGNAYITGVTYSNDFPVSPTAYGPSNKGIAQAFVTKLNPTGTALVYSTYIGGSGNIYGGDDATAIKVDSKGDAFIAGTTYSADFPVVGGFIQSINNCINLACSNGFITELNPTGSNLVNSTYIGGGAQGGIGDMVNAMALDDSGNVTITGTTASTDFPVTTGSYQTTNKCAANGYSTVFVAKLHSTFTSLDYSTFLGGTSGDDGLSITEDSAGNAYVAGSTYSTDFPVTSAAYQKTNRAATAKTGTNAFVTKLDPTGKTLVYSTFLGGTGNPNITGGDAANGIAIDSSGNASIAGSTTSADFPISSAAYQKTNKDEGNLAPSCFVTRLNPTGSSLVYSTYLGGSGLAGQITGDSCAAIVLDASDNAYVVGGSASRDFPVTAGALQAANNDPTYGNAFLTELNSTGSSLVYSTFLGGSDSKSALIPGDFASALALDTAGNVYLAGKTSSSNFPLTKGAYKTASAGVGVGFDTVFVAKITLGSSAPAATTTSLSANVNHQSAGEAVSFTAHVVPASGTAIPTGSVVFTVDSGTGTTATLNASAEAVYSDSALAVGAHTIKASYGGTASFTASSGTLTETITEKAATAPAFSPAVGTYAAAQSVSLTDSTTGAVIYYTTNGTTPTVSSTKYTTAIKIASTETIEAIAVATGYANSVAAKGTYTIETPTATPTFSIAAGTYTAAQSVTLKDTTTGAVIYYTTNGTTPTTSSTKYSTAVAVSATETIKAIAIASGYTTSAAASTAYTIEKPTATPTFSIAAGTYAAVQSVTLKDATTGAVIYYTLNGSTPTTASTKYAAAIAVSATETIKAIAIATGYTTSAVASAAYAIEKPTATPTFSITAGTYTAAQSVTLKDASTGAVIYYTLNGTTPTTASTKYAAAIAVSATETIKAIAIATGYTTSAVASAVYTIEKPAATPTFSITAGTYAAAQSVTLKDSTTDAVIYYTLNGATPTTASTKYAAAIAVSATETIKAIAVATGYTTSAVASATYTIEKPAATPTFSIAAGTYTAVQSVTLKDATAGAVIYYTVNGATPTTTSTKYTTAIAVSATETIKAIAVATSYATSAVASAEYTIEKPTATPTFSIGAGTYTAAQSLTLKDATTGAVIYYTLNGTTPTTASTKYSTAIAVSSTETIKAIAIATGYTTSAVASAVYTIEKPVATPTFSITAGTYTAAQSVTLKDATTGAVIYYTLNGTTPTTASTKYSAAIDVSATETIKAIAAATGYETSAVASAAYTIEKPAATPTFSIAAGTYTAAQSVTLKDATTGAVIYYTLNGTTPTTASTKYSTAIAVSDTETIKAIAIATGYTTSAVASAVYTIEKPVATPTFSITAGTYTAAQSVTLKDATTGAVIYYTLNGTTPTTASTKYSAAIAVSATETIKAIAVATGYTTSAVASAAYTIDAVAATPTFSIAAGIYAGTQSVTLKDTTTGAVIYYTTNGVTPTTTSTKYSAAIAVTATETIKAIAVATGYTTSAVASAAYTITTASAIVATPASLAFPVTTIGASDPAETITLKNTAKTGVSSLAVTITGTNASSFTKTQSCGTTLASGAACTVSVVMAPQTEGNRSEPCRLQGPGQPRPRSAWQASVVIQIQSRQMPIPTKSAPPRAISILSFSLNPRQTLSRTSATTSTTEPITTPSSTG